MGNRQTDSGVVLINVLVVLALASAVLVGMIRVSDLAIARSQTFLDAARAEALIAGGEASAVAVLLRDMAEAPGADHAGEPWAAIVQDEIAVEGGTFALTLADAQARFDLNSLRGMGGIGPQVLARVAERIGLPPDAADRIAARMARGTPLRRLDDLRAEAGLTVDQVGDLAGLVTLLPVPGDVNINTAPDDLLFALADNPVQARGLVALRRLKGRLTPEDMTAVQLVLLPGIGYASRLFEVRVTARIGAVEITGGSLLLRRIGAAGGNEVVAVRRWRGAVVP
ncbi:MAG: general secretion pathway protein GspK [Gemmobacter sp.]